MARCFMLSPNLLSNIRHTRLIVINSFLDFWPQRTTVMMLNSCTRCMGSPGIIHDCMPNLPPSYVGMDAWMTSQLNVALIHKLHGSLMCLALFLTYLSNGVCKDCHCKYILEGLLMLGLNKKYVCFLLHA